MENLRTLHMIVANRTLLPPSKAPSSSIKSGKHTSFHKGFGIEFSEYRAYEQGDNPKNIDWNHYAKTDKLYVKLYNEEKSLNVALVLDSSASMAFGEKWKKALELMMALGIIALKNDDNVQFSSSHAPFSQRIPNERALLEIVDNFYDMRIKTSLTQQSPDNNSLKSKSRMLDCLGALSSRKAKPDIIFILSDFLEPVESLSQAIDLSTKSSVMTVAIQILGAADYNPLQGALAAEAIDSETGKRISLQLDRRELDVYQKKLRKHTKAISELAVKTRLRYFLFDCTSKVSITSFVNESLVQGAILR